MQDVIKGHTVETFNEELSHLRALVLEMGELVVEQVNNAVKALCTGDDSLGQSVIDIDRKVDQFDLQADQEILRILALRQPMATDLRLILGFSKIVAELARGGNKAKKIASFAVKLNADEHRKPRKRLLRDVQLMKDKACRMLERSLEAVARMDVPEAIEVVREDDVLDDEFDAAMRHLSTFMLEDSSAIAQVLDMVFTVKALERVGDHAHNIAEQVVFVAEGRDVRYLNPEILEASSSAG